jgi:hypothetical protein
MRTRSTVLVSLLVSAGLPSILHAQTVEEIVARHIAARGGYERLKAVQSMRIVRTYGTFGANIPVVITKKRPALLRIDQTLPNGRTAARGVTGSVAWDRSPDGKVSERQPEAAAEARDIDADFDGLLVDYEKKGHKVAYTGRERIGGVDTHRLDVTLASGGTRIVYLDAESFLERRQVGSMTLPQGNTRVEVVLTFSDYRDVAGVKFPFAIDEERNAFPVQTIAIYTERIELDVPADDTMFAKPAS